MTEADRPVGPPLDRQTEEPAAREAQRAKRQRIVVEIGSDDAFAKFVPPPQFVFELHAGRDRSVNSDTNEA